MDRGGKVSDIYSDDSEERQYRQLDVNNAAFYISSGGPLALNSPSFEERSSQIQLLKYIAHAFNNEKLGAFEAGTGVGKSYAYLIPSALWALENKEKVVISTGTINLQSQLCEKDIPAVEKIIGKKIKYVLMKGRQNYICKRRLQDATLMPDLFEEDNDKLVEIAEWAKTTQTGSKSDLPKMPLESVWSRVNSESDACMGMRCPYHSECFVMKQRKEASQANIIVVNHHLLFADIESRMNGAGNDDAVVLPPFKRLVLDEAHGIEDSATSFFSESFTRFKLMKQVGLLFRSWKKTHAGFLVQVSAVSTAEDVIEMTMAGASAVQVGAENLRNPMACRDIVDALPPLMQRLGIESLRELTIDN